MKSNVFLSILLGAIFSAVLFISCEKESQTTPQYITYLVSTFVSDSIVVEYFSDFYHTSGELKPVYLVRDTNESYFNRAWTASHLLDAEDNNYYIKVDYFNYINLDSLGYGVKVYVTTANNETTLLDSAFFNTEVGTITLSGEILR